MMPRPLTLCGLIVGGFALAGCDEMTRFKQEKYECGLNASGIVEIDFRSMKVGDAATLVTNDGDGAATITFADDDEFLLEAEGLIIRIDRKTANIRATRGNFYREISCVKSEFRM